MIDEPGSAPRPQFNPLCIRLDEHHRKSQRAAWLLESLGGSRAFQGEGVIFVFPTIPRRDDALKLARSRFGWTVAAPMNGREGGAARQPIAPHATGPGLRPVISTG